MYPWAHFGVAYVAYTVSTRMRTRQSPNGRAVLVLLVGTQLPDLVDKPANYLIGLGDGRALGHSLLFLVPLCLGVYALARRSDRSELGVAFGVGALLHLPGDFWQQVLRPEPSLPNFLVWPLRRAPTYGDPGPTNHVAAFQRSVESLVVAPPQQLLGEQLVIGFAVALGCGLLWTLDGFPGSKTVWNASIGRFWHLRPNDRESQETPRR